MLSSMTFDNTATWNFCRLALKMDVYCMIYQKCSAPLRPDLQNTLTRRCSAFDADAGFFQAAKDLENLKLEMDVLQKQEEEWKRKEEELTKKEKVAVV